MQRCVILDTGACEAPFLQADVATADREAIARACRTERWNAARTSAQGMMANFVGRAAPLKTAKTTVQENITV